MNANKVEIKNFPLKNRRSRIFSSIERYYIPKYIFIRTLNELRKYGFKKYEGLVLWAGGVSCKENEAYITSYIIPKKGHWGGGVKLNSKMLLKLSNELSKRDLILLAQIHTHPGDFGHSPGDELHAVNYRIGFISIVVPDYGLVEINDLSNCYVYEYAIKWKWRIIHPEEVKDRFVIVDSVIKI